MNQSFLARTSKNRKPRLITIAVIVCIVAGAAIFAAHSDVKDILPDSSVLTPLQLLYTAALSGLFFLSIPVEAILFASVEGGSPPIASALSTFAGFLVGSAASYLIGYKLSRVALKIISAKRLYALRRKVNKHGGVFVFVANIIPFFPSPLLSFGLGIARYNPVRLFVLLVLGTALKFAAASGLAYVT